MKRISLAIIAVFLAVNMNAYETYDWDPYGNWISPKKRDQMRDDPRSTYYRTALVFAYSQVNSIFEDDNIKLEINDQQLWATNKTGKTIYVDVSQCFVFHNGSSFPFENLLRNIGDQKGSMIGFTTNVNIYITIPPKFGINQKPTFICNLSTHMFKKYSLSKDEHDKRLNKAIEELVIESKNRTDSVTEATKHFTEDESDSNIGVTMAYAFTKNTEEWTIVSLSTWLSDLIVAPCYLEQSSNPFILHIKADNPFEFEEDISPIIIGIWEDEKLISLWDINEWDINEKERSPLLNIEENKPIIEFDGKNDDWGKMIYVKSLIKTRSKYKELLKKLNNNDSK